jgi:multidrug efflux pump subunit AcrA (membrane-fusion protein)
MAHSDMLRIQLYVPQSAAFGVAPGVPAVIRVPEIPGRPFPGKVTRIADALDPATRTLLTEIDVPNPEGELSPGMYCTVELDVPRKTPSLLVPDPAVVFDAQGVYVFVVEDGVAHMRKITEIRDLGTEVEVSEGVKPASSSWSTRPSISKTAARSKFAARRLLPRHRKAPACLKLKLKTKMPMLLASSAFRFAFGDGRVY